MPHSTIIQEKIDQFIDLYDQSPNNSKPEFIDSDKVTNDLVANFQQEFFPDGASYSLREGHEILQSVFDKLDHTGAKKFYNLFYLNCPQSFQSILCRQSDSIYGVPFEVTPITETPHVERVEKAIDKLYSVDPKLGLTLSTKLHNGLIVYFEFEGSSVAYVDPRNPNEILLTEKAFLENPAMIPLVPGKRKLPQVFIPTKLLKSHNTNSSPMTRPIRLRLNPFDRSNEKIIIEAILAHEQVHCDQNNPKHRSNTHIDRDTKRADRPQGYYYSFLAREDLVARNMANSSAMSCGFGDGYDREVTVVEGIDILNITMFIFVENEATKIADQTIQMLQ